MSLQATKKRKEIAIVPLSYGKKSKFLVSPYFSFLSVTLVPTIVSFDPFENIASMQTLLITYNGRNFLHAGCKFEKLKIFFV